jgi:hypothetical protein
VRLLLFLLPVLWSGCGRPVAPTPAAGPQVVDSSAATALEVNGLTLTRAEVDLRVPAVAATATRRQALEHLVDVLLAASEARTLEPYRALPPLEAGERFLDEHFAPERFCAALPESELKAWYRAHRTRYVHPDHHVVAALRATPTESRAELEGALEAAFAAALTDEERYGADAFESATARWTAVTTALGALPAAELWTFFAEPEHPERTPPVRWHPEDTAAVVALCAGQRTALLADDDGVRLYVKLEGNPARRRDLSEREVRDDVRRQACAGHLTEARRRWLDDLRKNARVVVTPE